MFNTVTVGDSVYLFPDYMTAEVAYLHNYCNNEYVDIKNFSAECFKYDGVEGKFSVFTHYPSTATSLYKTASFDPLTGKCWVVGGTHDMFAMYSMDLGQGQGQDAEEGVGVGAAPSSWELDYNFSGVTNTTGPLPIAIHIPPSNLDSHCNSASISSSHSHSNSNSVGLEKQCRFHMIGGHNSRYHEVWDSKQRRMRPVYEFATRLKGRELVYVSQWDALFMFGGCLWEGTNFRDTVRFRYINDFYRCNNPNDVDHIKWERMEGEQWHLPHKMMGFGHLLLDDTKLVIFGGRVAGGEYIDEIWMFDMASPQWFQSTLRIPQKGKYRAAFIRSAGQIELFQYGHPALMNQTHFTIKVDVLMRTMKKVTKLPTSSDANDAQKVRLHNHRVFEEQRSKYCARDLEQAINAVINNKELSNRQKRKMVRKMKAKSWKYSKPSPFQKPTKTKRTTFLVFISTENPKCSLHSNENGDKC